MTISRFAQISEVSKSTISRIEAGISDPAWTAMVRLIAAAGYRVSEELPLEDSGSDERLAWFLRKYRDGNADERDELLKWFYAIAQVSCTVYRVGHCMFEMPLIPWPNGVGGRVYGDLPTVLRRLEDQGQEPILSGSQASSRRTDLVSFVPLIYVRNPETVEEFARGRKGSFKTMKLMTTTDNVREFTSVHDGTRFVSDEWALIDSLATPDRTSDYALAEWESRLERVGNRISNL
jgi:transcriptional regulator with XRE-family HTH domain